MKHFLSFDVGTTSMKCMLYDDRFHTVFSRSYEYDLVFGENGFVEIDANVYTDTFWKCIGEIEKLKEVKPNIVSLTFTTQGETFVCVDESGKVLRKAIIWLDARASEETEYILSTIGKEKFYFKTGLYEPDGALPLSKLLWIKKNEPEIYSKTYKFLLLEDYLIYSLTNEFVTEKSLVSSSGWYDIIRNKYYDDALKLCGISADKFPQVRECGTVAGKADSHGILSGAVVVCGAMDQIASAIGAGNIYEGKVTETTGTALVIGATTDNPKFDIEHPVTMYKHYNDKFLYMPYCNTAGVVLKWFRDNVAREIVDKASERNVSAYKVIDEYAERSVCGSNGVVLMPHFAVSGGFLGISLGTTLEDLSRSVLEGIAFTLKDMLQELEKKGIEISKVTSLGGGSKGRLWSEIKASVCDVEIIVNKNSETTALGAAILGAVAVNCYATVEEALRIIPDCSEVIYPDESARRIYDNVYEKYKKIYKSLNSIFC